MISLKIRKKRLWSSRILVKRRRKQWNLHHRRKISWNQNRLKRLNRRNQQTSILKIITRKNGMIIRWPNRNNHHRNSWCKNNPKSLWSRVINTATIMTGILITSSRTMPTNRNKKGVFLLRIRTISLTWTRICKMMTSQKFLLLLKIITWSNRLQSNK